MKSNKQNKKQTRKSRPLHKSRKTHKMKINRGGGLSLAKKLSQVKSVLGATLIRTRNFPFVTFYYDNDFIIYDITEKIDRRILTQINSKVKNSTLDANNVMMMLIFLFMYLQSYYLYSKNKTNTADQERKEKQANVEINSIILLILIRDYINSHSECKEVLSTYYNPDETIPEDLSYNETIELLKSIIYNIINLPDQEQRKQISNTFTKYVSMKNDSNKVFENKSVYEQIGSVLERIKSESEKQQNKNYGLLDYLNNNIEKIQSIISQFLEQL